MFLAQLQQATEQLSKKVAEVRAAEQDVKFLQDNDGELYLMQPVLTQEQNACLNCLHRMAAMFPNTAGMYGTVNVNLPAIFIRVHFSALHQGQLLHTVLCTLLVLYLCHLAP